MRNNQPMRIYLAVPYTDPSSEIRQRRYEYVTGVCANLMEQGHIVFSPITHSHYLAEIYGLPNVPGFWSRWYMTFLEHWATDLYILMMDGWDKSNGVRAEIEFSQIHNIPITFISSVD